ncbi:hypothetical protein ACQPZK_07610 [Micromonospora sp. CA-249363]|uniref:hypothetical protein n=1 Tax=Micromonospora sp. CA-249363 TaxID=3239963 RepID=UPI003D9301A8
MSQGSSEVAELPIISVEAGTKPELIVMKRDDEVVGWALVFPDGSAWLLRSGVRSMIHSGSLATLVNFWASIFDCDVGVPEEA